MGCAIAFYKGPPTDDVWHIISHYAIRLWTWSKYSHAELVINGYCYSSSARDGGVRFKKIDLGSGRWDVIPVRGSQVEALWWFDQHKGQPYDWLNILRYLFPFIPQRADRWVCFEAISAMLGLAGGHKLTGGDLYKWAMDCPVQIHNF